MSGAGDAPNVRRNRQLEQYRRARKVMPGGTDSNWRAWGEGTVYVDRGEGGLVWDADGNELVDLRMGYGPVILGHGDPRVDDYVNERMRLGVSFSLTSEDEIRANELITDLTFCDKSRLTVSGTEATMHAIRLARAHTGREKVVKFEGQYHGVHDYALISVIPNDVSALGDRDNPVRLTFGRGIPEAITQTMIPVPFNDTDVLRRLFEREGEEIAAVLIEPILGNAQGILPSPGFHPEVRRLTEEYGVVLIYDEVKTGFRVAKGGSAELFGVTPDLATYAKAMGNGYPAAAFGGRREIMDLLPDSVSHGGTYAGNRVAAAAAVKTLSILKETDALRTIEATGEKIQAGVKEITDKRGLPVSFSGVPAMFGVVFSDHIPTEYRKWVEMDNALYDAVASGMYAFGAMPEPDSREPWFMCEAHSRSGVVDRVLSAFEHSLDLALEHRAEGEV